MRYSRIVIVGNSYLENRANLAGAKNVYVLPTVVDTKAYSVDQIKNHAKIRLGWVGSPTTTKYLYFLKPVIEKLIKNHDFEFIIINAPHTELPDFSCEYRLVIWKEEEEGDQISKLDIGLMPLPYNAWEKGKCAYKLIQYMACGLPVVASPVGMNRDVVVHGENGFLATDEKEWTEALSTLISDSALRKKMGEAGRNLVEEQFTVEKNFERMKKMILEIEK